MIETSVGNRPVNAHIIMRETHSSGGCVADRDDLGNSALNREFRRPLSCGMKVCDLYQCVHQNGGEHNGMGQGCDTQFARRFSESMQTRDNHYEVGQSTSTTEFDKVNIMVTYSDAGNDMHKAGTVVGKSRKALSGVHVATLEEIRYTVKEGDVFPSLGSSNDRRILEQAGSTFFELCTTSDSSSDSAYSDEYEHSAPSSAGSSISGDYGIQLSSPCSRHHHRRNSVAVKFSKMTTPAGQ